MRKLVSRGQSEMLECVLNQSKNVCRGFIWRRKEAVQKPSRNCEFLSSMFWSHPKWLQMSGFDDFLYLFAFKTSSKTMRSCPWILEFIVFFSKLNCDLPKKYVKQKKKTFFPLICTLFANNVLFATRLPFVNRRLLLSGTFWTGGVCYIWNATR